MDQRLKDLGANSMDRMEIVTMTIESLGVEMPLIEISKANNIGDIVNILAAKLNDK